MQGLKWEPAVKQNTRQGRLYILVLSQFPFVLQYLVPNPSFL